jgi:(S)-sulfolactate dehydrogenase
MRGRPVVVQTRLLESPKAQARLSESADIVLVDGLESLRAALPGADAFVAIPPLKVEKATLELAVRLKVVATVTSGSDHLAVSYLEERGIPVFTGLGKAPDAVSEYVHWAAVAVHRGFFRQALALHQGDLDWSARFGTPRSTELRGTTFGVVGLGHVGRSVATRMASLPGVRVIAHDPFVRPVDSGGIELVGLEELFQESTTVSLNVPLMDSTRGLVGARLLGALGPDGVLVNAARAGVVVEHHLLEALRSGDIKGAAIDVFDVEPASRDVVEGLASTGRIVLTPHLAGVSEQALEALCNFAVDSVLKEVC